MTDEFRYQNLERRLRALLERDLKSLMQKERDYGRSWMRRGGIGAYMVSVRKFDRIEKAIEREGEGQYDIFARIKQDSREEGILDDIRDYRAYLLLIEEELMYRGAIPDVLPRVSDMQKDMVKGSTMSLGSDGVIGYAVGTAGGRGGAKEYQPYGYDPELDDPPATVAACSKCGKLTDKGGCRRVMSENFVCSKCWSAT